MSAGYELEQSYDSLLAFFLSLPLRRHPQAACFLTALLFLIPFSSLQDHALQVFECGIGYARDIFNDTK